MLIYRWLFFACLLFPAVMAWPQSSAAMPDAPRPAIIARPAALDPLLDQTNNLPKLPSPGWRPYIDLDQTIRPLTAGEKMKFCLHLEAVPYSPLPSFVSAGFEQGIDGNPKFGTDSGAFGERLGAAFIRDASMRFFVSSLFPVLLREDPRYYRMHHGRIVARGVWAGEQALVTRSDSGAITPNYSDLLGHLAACVLTLYYYPAPSANGGVVAEAWVTSIAGDAGNNLLLEFVPSIVSRWQRHRRRVRSRSSKSRRSSSIP
jgi:hypothetical protein